MPEASAPSAPQKQPLGAVGGGCLSVLILIGLFWLVGYCSRSSEPPTASATNAAEPAFVDLDARIHFNGTQFAITNQSKDAWTALKLEVNGGFLSGGYLYRADALGAGKTITVGAMQFAKSDGTRLNPFQTKPQKLTLQAKVKGRDGFYYGEWK